MRKSLQPKRLLRSSESNTHPIQAIIDQVFCEIGASFLLEKFMKKAFRLGMLPAMLVAVVFGFSAANASAQGAGPLREILNRMDSMNKSLTSIKADV